MDTKFDFHHDTDTPVIKGVVYVRPVAVADLPQEVQQAAMGADELYALHAENGQRLALVRNRSMAFMLARQNDLAAVNVH